MNDKPIQSQKRTARSRATLLLVCVTCSLSGCDQNPAEPDGPCDEAGVCGECIDVGAPLSEFRYVVVDDVSVEPEIADGHAGADLWCVSLVCDGALVTPLELAWARGSGVICEGQQIEGVCPPGVVRTNPEVVRAAGIECPGPVRPRPDDDEPSVLSLGVDGALVLRYERSVLGCDISVGEWEAGLDGYLLRYCTAPPAAGGICTHLRYISVREGSWTRRLSDPTTTCP